MEKLKELVSHIDVMTACIVSVGLLILSIVATVYLILYLPENYFTQPKRIPRFKVGGKIRWGRLSLFVGKNILGWVLLLLGVLMLVLPGQGVITILVATIMIDFPGKYRLERWLVQRPKVLSAINRLRKRFSKPQLKMD